MINDKIVCTEICKYDYEELDDEVIMFLNDYEKIVILNKSAGIIWNTLIKNINNEISINELAQVLSDSFDVLASNFQTVVDDIKELLEAFVLERMIVLNGDVV